MNFERAAVQSYGYLWNCLSKHYSIFTLFAIPTTSLIILISVATLFRYSLDWMDILTLCGTIRVQQCVWSAGVALHRINTQRYKHKQVRFRIYHRFERLSHTSIFEVMKKNWQRFSHWQWHKWRALSIECAMRLSRTVKYRLVVKLKVEISFKLSTPYSVPSWHSNFILRCWTLEMVIVVPEQTTVQ